MIAKTIGTAIAAAVIALAGASGSMAQQPAGLNGTWVIGEGEGTIVIRGSDWFHSKKGAATLRHGTGAADYDVFYRSEDKIKCSYRVLRVFHGEALILEPDNPSQPLEFCPSGKLTRVSR